MDVYDTLQYLKDVLLLYFSFCKNFIGIISVLILHMWKWKQRKIK